MNDVVISLLIVLNEIVYLLIALMLVFVTTHSDHNIVDGVDTISTVPLSTK